MDVHIDVAINVEVIAGSRQREGMAAAESGPRYKWSLRGRRIRGGGVDAIEDAAVAGMSDGCEKASSKPELGLPMMNYCKPINLFSVDT
jgi:hypothetical protein